jgi:hypothetical protein
MGRIGWMAAWCLAAVLLLAGAPAQAEMSDEELRGWFSCKECEVFAEGIGIASAAAIIAANPEGSAAKVAMSAVYHGMTDHYGHHMDLENFVHYTKSFLGPLSVAEFVIKYPKFVCCLFGKCSCSGYCDC